MVIFRNDIRLGLILGTITPIFMFVYYYFTHFYPVSFWSQYWQLLLTDHLFLQEITVGFVMFNILLFFLYTNANKIETALGIFIPTLFIGITTFLTNALIV